jgi:hypothetical protein
MKRWTLWWTDGEVHAHVMRAVGEGSKTPRPDRGHIDLSYCHRSVERVRKSMSAACVSNRVYAYAYALAIWKVGRYLPT